MANEGWVKLYRKLMENPIVTKDADHLAIWIYLLLNATHDGYPALFKGKKIMLQPGQLLTGCISISERLGVNESKVRRVLKSFESDGQIDRQISNKNSLISIQNWEFYQNSDSQNDEQMTDNRRTSDGQVTTNKNVNNVINNINNISCANPKTKNEELEEFFESIWKLYPVKKGKGQISKTKKQNLQKIGYEHIKRCVERFVKEMERLKRDKKYWMHGSTFFNSGYVDYLDSNYEKEEEFVEEYYGAKLF